jgi:hypothetical protein
MRQLPYPLPVIATLMMAACSTTTPPPVYHSESFDVETPYQFHSDIPAPTLCANGRRALLSQGYEVDTATPLTVKGEKFFQQQTDKQVQLRITLVCLDEAKGSTAYANALQTRSELKASSNSTGLSVAAVGSISLPWTTDKGGLAKVGEETITDPEFYHRLFVLIDMLKD